MKRDPYNVRAVRAYLADPANERTLTAFEIYNLRGISLTWEQWDDLLNR